ncbi:hypothetical protein LEP1GSC096_0877 [Leptospira interrogans serovar Hebdomadis str. R499]|nr:hypothetical protein LEP1GSC045_3337 [Leptospira interrogans serovar Pomona str. Kennewicki LC82-25]EKN97378.1 hypothetical protein LEP1GSC014_0923 [Leptospira interrogans serovar Pomona str. Pomona]EKR35303.1 hypothetical protein LEP1GSC096_0877 [Leptospira interrogans serovar Hebdomadis str. R499]EMF31408.1 hypothetical protein LEP1GSC201_3538 [Leptospira interrogans serovar Pomona str. Fox 32256]EMI60949.1 hypothetical protein LEP1GSC200_0576 [Leptospira interrogans serovar Pomona str. CS
MIQEAFEKWLDSKNFDENGQQKISLSSLTESLLAQKDHFILIK